MAPPQFSSGLDFSCQFQTNIANCLLDIFPWTSKQLKSSCLSHPLPAPAPLLRLSSPYQYPSPPPTQPLQSFLAPPPLTAHASTPTKSCQFYHQSFSNIHPFSPSNMSLLQAKPHLLDYAGASHRVLPLPRLCPYNASAHSRRCQSNTQTESCYPEFLLWLSS